MNRGQTIVQMWSIKMSNCTKIIKIFPDKEILCLIGLKMTGGAPALEYQTLKSEVSVSVVGAIWRTNKPIVSDNKFLSISAVVSGVLERSCLV